MALALGEGTNGRDKGGHSALLKRGEAVFHKLGGDPLLRRAEAAVAPLGRAGTATRGRGVDVGNGPVPGPRVLPQLAGPFQELVNALCPPFYSES